MRLCCSYLTVVVLMNGTEQLVKGRINVCPDYQRGKAPVYTTAFSFMNSWWMTDVVWPDTKQSYLIDSILRNLLTTPVIFCASFSRFSGLRLIKVYAYRRKIKCRWNQNPHMH